MSLGGESFTTQAACDAANGPTKGVIDNLRSAAIATVLGQQWIDERARQPRLHLERGQRRLDDEVEHDLVIFQFGDVPLVVGTRLVDQLVGTRQRVRRIQRHVDGRAHRLELRTAINAKRASKGLGAFPFTDGTLTAGTTLIRAAHITEIRSAISQAYTAAGLIAPSFTDASLAAGVTPIRAGHIMELRAAVLNLP